MNDFSNQRWLCWDYGLFPSVAEHLAETVGCVQYYLHWKSAYPDLNLALIGSGLEKVERVRDFFDHVEGADLIYFPDLGDGDLQKYLRSKGKRVWGTDKAENLENFRWETKQLFKKVGMPMNQAERVVGIQNLKARLKGETAILWIKFSTFRKTWETKKFCGDYRVFEPFLDELAWRTGPAGKLIEFIVDHDIPDAAESGYDGWNIDGKWPINAMLGYEAKGAGLIGKVMPYSEFPPEVVNVNTRIAPLLEHYGCRGNVSSELRNGIPIDPCQRSPSPPGELYPSMYTNFDECVYAGAGGELAVPEIKWEYGCEIVLESNWSEKNWCAVYYPKEIEPFVKLRNYAHFDGEPYVLPMDQGPRVGAVIGLGHTVKEACLKAMEYAEQVKGAYIESSTESVGQGLKAIAQAQEEGVNFTDEKLPTQEELEKELEG